ncbi:bacteriophage holin [Actinoalloteichus fjordicus]|uniref:bacteriophage holin n=1 Tax=Actinoalloteichus TaxID=65496 RepID=UPI00095151F8
MSYLLSGLMIALGLLLLVVVVLRLLRSVRTVRRAQSRLRRTVEDRGGLLRARLAAVEVAVKERRRPMSRPRHGHTDENGSIINVQPGNR